MKTCVLMLCLAACAPTAPSTATAPPKVDPASLYTRLGQKPVIAAVVDDFVVTMKSDPRLSVRFARTEPSAFKTKLADQFCHLSGGPCLYTGRPMRDAHLGMRITGAEFDAMIEDLKKSLDRFAIPGREQGELLTILGPMKRDIAGR